MNIITPGSVPTQTNRKGSRTSKNQPRQPTISKNLLEHLKKEIQDLQTEIKN